MRGPVFWVVVTRLLNSNHYRHTLKYLMRRRKMRRSSQASHSMARGRDHSGASKEATCSTEPTPILSILVFWQAKLWSRHSLVEQPHRLPHRLTPMIFWHTKSKGSIKDHNQAPCVDQDTLHPVCLLSLYFSVIIIISTEDHLFHGAKERGHGLSINQSSRSN